MSADSEAIKPMSDSGHHVNMCANCGSTAATSYCSGCRDAPTTAGLAQDTAVYCGKECQKAHWPQHLKECRNLQARRSLFRAAGLLQKTWSAVRRASFYDCPVKAEEVNGELVIHEGDWDAATTKRKGGFYREFPEDIFENKEDAEACLNMLFCTDSLNHMYMMSAWLLKGLCSMILEADVGVTKTPRRARYHKDVLSREYIHQVLKVSLKSGETYAIDLTGAQYGWHKPIALWTEYCDKVLELCIVQSQGTSKKPHGFQHVNMTVMTFSNPRDHRTQLQRAIPMCSECLKLQFNQALQVFLERYTGGSQLLRLSQAAFETAEKEIVAFAKQTTDVAAEKIDVLCGLVLGEAIMANEKMLQNPLMAKGRILAEALVKLACTFNGVWERDSETGVLISVTLMRLQVDVDYRKQMMKGSLPSQQSWAAMTRSY